MLVRRFRALTLAAALFTLAGGVASAQTKAPAVTTPKQFFGFNIGDDYNLATYDQFVQYWQKIDKESSRMQVIEIGKTEEGRPASRRDRHRPGELRQARSLQADRPAAASRARHQRGAGAGASRRKARRWSGSTAACTPPRWSARIS
jgi:hypothetical protein